MRIARQMWDCSVDVAGALDAMDSINAYEQFLEVEHLNQPSFQLLRLRQLIPDADTFGFIGDHREGMENRKVG